MVDKVLADDDNRLLECCELDAMHNNQRATECTRLTFRLVELAGKPQTQIIAFANKGMLLLPLSNAQVIYHDHV